MIEKPFIKQVREATPNDRKLSDRGARRDGCAGEGGGAAGVTRGTVRCSAWLAVIGLSLWIGAFGCAHGVVNALDHGVAFEQGFFRGGSLTTENLYHLDGVNEERVEHVRGKRCLWTDSINVLAKTCVMIGCDPHGDVSNMAAFFGALGNNDADNGRGAAEKSPHNDSDDGSGGSVEWHTVLGICVGYGVGSVLGLAIVIGFCKRKAWL